MTANIKDINATAMDVILNAGEGRALIDSALSEMAELNFIKADQLLDLAEKKVVEAHVAQTKVIQSQVSGEEQIEYSLLFVHAQDTLMTINTELRLTRQMLKIFETLNNKIERRD